MPIFIPILIGAAVVGVTGYGGKKVSDGVSAMKRAKVIGERAEARHKRHVALLDSAREHLRDRVQELHQRRVSVVGSTLQRMVDLLSTLERRGKLRKPTAFEQAGVDREEVPAFVAEYLEAAGVATGGLAAVGAGAGASAIATGLVTSLATASTGTAISALSGAAAESAMLAWLGGGALAAGGWGMAAGALVLNGIAIAPAVAIGGFVLSAQGEKAVTKAEAFSSKVGKAVATIDALIAFHHRAEERVNELSDVLARLDVRAGAALERMDQIVRSFDEDDEDHVRRLATALLACKAVSELVHAKIIDDDGQLDRASEATLGRLKQALLVAEAHAEVGLEVGGDIRPRRRAQQEGSDRDNVRSTGKACDEGTRKPRRDRKSRGRGKGGRRRRP